MKNRTILLLLLLAGCGSHLGHSGTKGNENRINWKIDSTCSKELEKTISKEFNQPMAIYYSDSVPNQGRFIFARDKKINDKYNGKIVVPDSEMGHWLILLGNNCEIKSIIEQY